MITELQITTALSKVFVPTVEQSVTDLNLVRKIAIVGDKITITLASTALTAEVQNFVAAGIKAALQDFQSADINIALPSSTPWMPSGAGPMSGAPSRMASVKLRRIS